MSPYYHKPDVYPNEQFIQHALENYFKREGYTLEEVKDHDLVCTAPTGERWLIEVKGSPENADNFGNNFYECSGQILQRMQDSQARYVMAFPADPRFVRQGRKVAKWVRSLVHLHYLFVYEDASVSIFTPEDNL